MHEIFFVNLSFVGHTFVSGRRTLKPKKLKKLKTLSKKTSFFSSPATYPETLAYHVVLSESLCRPIGAYLYVVIAAIHSKP